MVRDVDIYRSDCLYRISEFAEKLNVSVQTLRRWDKNELLVANRTESNRRYYTDDHFKSYNTIKSTRPDKLSRRKHFKYKDLTGERFGKLTVVMRVDDYVATNGHRHIQWLCKCDCGDTSVVKGASLSSGYNKSCGCSQYGNGETKRMWDNYKKLKLEELDSILSKESNSVGRPRTDLTDTVYGWLTVIRAAPDKVYSNNRRISMWHCSCKCGKTIDVKTINLKNGSKVSCGCMPKDMKNQYVKPMNKGYNKLINLTGESFSYWSVLSQAEPKIYPSGGRVVQWLCECKCGVKKIVPGRDLRSGASQSCGCMTSNSWMEKHVEAYLKENNIKYKKQKTYKDLLGTGGKPLLYDFLILHDDDSPHMLIECQGEQHYRPIRKFGGAKKLVIQQIHDDLKQKYATDVVGVPCNEIMYGNTSKSDVISRLKQFGLA